MSPELALRQVGGAEGREEPREGSEEGVEGTGLLGGSGSGVCFGIGDASRGAREGSIAVCREVGRRRLAGEDPSIAVEGSAEVPEAHARAAGTREEETLSDAKIAQGAAGGGADAPARTPLPTPVPSPGASAQAGGGSQLWIFLERERRALGPMTFAEKAVGGHALVLMVLWFTRSAEALGGGWSQLFPQVCTR